MLYVIKKIPLILILLFTNVAFFSQETASDGFLKLPETDGITGIVKKINPNINYRIWAFVYYDFKTDKIIYQTGNKKINPKRLVTDRYGFFPCLPGGCYYYFYVIGKNAKEDYIIEDHKLIKFFGKIDRIEEALFIAMEQGFAMDPDYKKGNIYKEFKNEFILYLSKISYSPYKKEAFTIIINKNSGELTVKSDGIYKYDPDIRISI